MDSDTYVDPEDVYSAMAEALVETNSMFRVRSMPDPERQILATGAKPPREIFYRNTVTFMTQIPPPLLPKRCTCKFLCHGAKAVLKCLSCAIYDAAKVGYFCQMCFNAQHPWYRVPHIFAAIDQDENIEYILKIQDRCAKAARLEYEGQEVLDKTRNSLYVLQTVGDDTKSDINLRHAARTSVEIETRILEMKRFIRSDLRSSGRKLHFDEDEASVVISRLMRGFKVRSLISRLFAERLLRVWDPVHGRDFYFDKVTQVSPRPNLLPYDLHLIMMPFLFCYPGIVLGAS